MLIALDTHVHLYDCYDLNQAFQSAFDNLHQAAPHAEIFGICLAERRGQHVFEEIKLGIRTIGEPFTVELSADSRVLIVSRADDRRKLYVIPGRQIVSREKIEVLGLFLPGEIPDGSAAAETLAAVSARNALPVLSWAPGKWLFSRGRIVRALIEDAPQGSLLVGDTSLRPPLWLRPLNHRAALRRAMPLIYGSDPLPIAGEERLIGSYATLLEGGFDDATPFDSLRSAFRGRSGMPRCAGRRSGLFAVLKRLRNNQKVRSDGST